MPESAHLADLMAKARVFLENAGSNKGEIAQALGFSRSNSPGLKELFEELARPEFLDEVFGQVAPDPDSDFAELQNELASRLRLRYVRVVEAYDKMLYGQQHDALGRAAAGLFGELLDRPPKNSVGIGGGGSLKHMVDHIITAPRDISIAPTNLIGREPEERHHGAEYLARRIYDKSRGPDARLYTTGMLPPPEDEEARKQFKALVANHIPSVASVLDRARRAQVSFLGIKGARSERILDRADVEREEALGDIVGDLNYNYFDRHGNLVARGFTNVSLDALREMSANPRRQTVVLVAGGSHKRDVVRIAIETKMVNSLVTDDKMARYLLRQIPTQHS